MKENSLFIELIYVNIFKVELLISIDYSNSYAARLQFRRETVARSIIIITL